MPFYHALPRCGTTTDQARKSVEFQRFMTAGVAHFIIRSRNSFLTSLTKCGCNAIALVLQSDNRFSISLFKVEGLNLKM